MEEFFYVEIVKNCTKEQLMLIIQGKILESSIINTDSWKAYDGLILNGLNDKKFILHLKESEFRFNNRKQNLYKILLKMIRENPL